MDFITVADRSAGKIETSETKWRGAVFRFIFLVATILLSAQNRVEAEPVLCKASLNGAETFLSYNSETIEYQSFVEKWWYFAPNCPADIVLTVLLPKTDAADKQDYCLTVDELTGAYTGAVRGKRDRYGRCARTGGVCKVVNRAKEEAIDAAIATGGVIVGSNATLSAAGITVVEHSSGMSILTGGSGYIAGTLGTVGTAAVGVATSSAALATAAAGAVIIGGAVLICSE